MKLKIGDTEFSVKIADTQETRTAGLKSVKAGSMPKTAGLVLKFDTPTNAIITMKDMKFPIDIIFVGDNKVQKVISAEPDQGDISIKDKSDFILEVPSGAASDIKPGDLIDWIGEKLGDGTIQMAHGGVVAADNAMQVLDENGKVQTNIQGNERVFSRKHTALLIELAESASKSKSESDYKKLGKAMVRIIDKQNTQEQEYVKT